MNIQALSDTELNRAMIWLYPPEYRKYHPFKDDGEYCWSSSYEDTVDHDYLGDYSQTIPLAVENELSVCFGFGTTYADMDGIDATNDKNPLRAICEVLVMIGMEVK